MQFTWKFTAKKANGKPVTGLVVAASEVFAISKIRKMGFTHAQASFDFVESLSTGFGLAMPSDFNLREKARFYETTARRLKTGGTLKEAFEAAKEYIDDGRLLSAVSIAVAAQDGGEQAWKAMDLAGFPRRDVMVIKALDQMGGLSNAFHDLANEVKLRYQTENSINKALSTPKFMIIMAYAFLPAIFGFIGPRMSKAFKQLGGGLEIPADIKAFYAFIELVNQSPTLWIGVYLLLGALGVLIVKTGVISMAMQKSFKSFRDLTTKSEHAQLWTVYGLMYGANINPVEICGTLRPACKLKETAEALNVMSRRLGAGANEVSAVEAAAFPRFAIVGYKAAKEGGNLPEGLRVFAELLNEDVSLLTEKINELLQRVSLFIGVGILLLVMYFTYYPAVAPILKSL